MLTDCSPVVADVQRLDNKLMEIPGCVFDDEKDGHDDDDDDEKWI